MDNLVTINAVGATVTWDGHELSVKHRGMGRVSTYADQIIGVEMRQPRTLIMGKMRVATMSSMHSGLMPKEPWHVLFGKKQAAEFERLYREIMAARRQD